MGNSEQSVWVDVDNVSDTAKEDRGSEQKSQVAGAVVANAGAGAANSGTLTGVAQGEAVAYAGSRAASAGVMAGAVQGTAAANAGVMAGAVQGTAAANAGVMAGAVQGTAAANAAEMARTGTAAPGPATYTVVPGKPMVRDTEETKLLKDNFGFVAPAAFVYAVFYVFCMYKNGSGITFPFFVAGSLVFLRLCSSKLGITLKKGSGFYMAAMVLLGISTFCTDDGRIIFFNKLGVFLLMMSLLLKQFCNTEKWKLGKFLGSICVLACVSIGEWERPFSDGKLYWKNKPGKRDKRIGYFLLGLLIGLPLLLVVLLLLASADAVFRQMTRSLLENISLINIFGILFRLALVFLGSYGLIAYLCKRAIKDEVKDRRNGEPVLAITITVLLTLLYLLFCVIQIAGLFLGKLKLPSGYTYAMYAREGFFQLLAVSFLNLIIVLVCMEFFKESKALKGVLTVMSLCTFVMIASSALRMVIYIRYYYLTFLRILVLWGLALLAVLFVGVVINIIYENFPFFRYSMAVVAALYLALSFAHPDYLIAKVNVANVHGTAPFFLAKEPFQDYAYLRGLCADAAPVLVPFLEELGYHMEAFEEEDAVSYAKSIDAMESGNRVSQDAFGYYWMERIQQRTENLGIRTFNVSRYLAVSRMRKAAEK